LIIKLDQFFHPRKGLDFSQDLSSAAGEIQVHAALPSIPAFIVGKVFNLKKS
jgi:hypothetical protein